MIGCRRFPQCIPTNMTNSGCSRGFNDDDELFFMVYMVIVDWLGVFFFQDFANFSDLTTLY